MFPRPTIVAAVAFALAAAGAMDTVASSATPARRVAAAPVTYSAAAGTQPAGQLGSDPFGAVLPSGRVVTPAGENVVVGMNALRTAITPDGRFAIVSCDDEREGRVRSAIDPRITGGYALTVVDTARMAVVEQYRDPKESFFAGIIAIADPAHAGRTLVLAAGGGANAVFAFGLDASGHLTPDDHHTIAVPGPADPAFADQGHSFPATLVPSPNGARVYVVDELGNAVSTIDTSTRTLIAGSSPVGFFPLGATISGDRLLVLNEGLMRYDRLTAPVAVPPFRVPPRDLSRASSLSFVLLGQSGAAPDLVPGALPFAMPPLAMDPAPDGLNVVGGAHPVAVVTTPANDYAFVAMANVDRIAAVALGTSPRVVGGTELRLFDRAPYGTQPSDLAITHDGARLYVTLAGLDAVAVIDARDPIHLHRIGLIPTGWYPTAITLADGDRTLYVTNTKGFGHDRGFSGDPETGADSNAVWSTLEKIDLQSVRLAQTTPKTLADTRRISPVRADPIVPQTLAAGPSKRIKHVVVILEENKTYDSMLGDLTTATGAPHGPGEPRFTAYGADVTPNLHALARRFALAGNVFADAEESDMGHQFAAGGIASLYGERTQSVKADRRPLVNKNEDPEDYPRAGYIFHNLARRHATFRDYGDLVRLAGYDEGAAKTATDDDPAFVNVGDTQAPTQGLGGRYSLGVPAPAVLAGHVDLNYPGWNLRIRDERRAHEFIRDFSALARANRVPAYTYIWLPADHTGRGADIPPPTEEVADGDRALGTIVAYLSHLPTWSSTAIFIMPDDSQGTRDHVDEYRTYTLVVSPYARAGYVGRNHLSTVSVLKTTEELLGLPPLSLGDLLATDMSAYFTAKPNVQPYTAIPVPAQTGSPAGDRIASLMPPADPSGPDADAGRSGAIAELSRRADLLSRRRSAYAPGVYATMQGRLFDDAVALAERGGH